MTVSVARFAYRDCEEVLNKAKSANSGVRVHVPDRGSAIHFRMRLHQCRKIDRRENRRIYPEDHPMWGSSAWDDLVVRIKEIDDEVWVYLEKRTADILRIESIDDVPRIEHKPTLQLEHKPEPELAPAPPLTRRRV